MKHLIEFPLEDGGAAIIEVDEPEGVRRAARTGEVVETASQKFEEALGKIKPAIKAVITKLREIGESPDEVGIEFGIKLGAKAGAFIASADAEANFKVTLAWKRKEDGDKK
jgi:alkanesulfonate monooxygenase SsuD/methylene tetrahydromethanopterin reductase-like flavin-dependent oxidoreductase (luciferase family)